MAKVPEWQRLTQYCEKHNQRYMQFLHQCPICAGEMLARLPTTPLCGLAIAEELIPNKMYGHDQQERPAVERREPEQLALF